MAPRTARPRREMTEFGISAHISGVLVTKDTSHRIQYSSF
jgi:hypothetical protein